MKNSMRFIIAISLLILSPPLFAWKWVDLWQTGDQQGLKLLQAGKAQEAAQAFENKDWQATALYRAGNYAQSWQAFKEKKTSDSQYNAGNAAAYLGRYQEAIDAYDKAIALNANNTDAIANREIIKKLMQENNKNKSSSNTKDDKKDQKDQKDKTGDDQADSQPSQNKDNKQQDATSQPQTKNSQPSENKNQLSDKQKADAKQQEEQAPAPGQVQAQNEDKKQLLRRLTDDPGGLLRQKFLRDYFRRHNAENPDQGDN